MYRYLAYGLGIHSDIWLPELIEFPDAPPDVMIRLGEVARPDGQTDDAEFFTNLNPDDAYFYWDTVGAFRIREGREIQISPIPEVEQPLLRIVLLGSISAVLLYQRGLLVLHASAVALKSGGAVAFLGEKGMGKSTMSAMLYGRGHQLISDDIVALDMRQQPPTLLSGYPYFKLWPDAAITSLGDDPESLPRVASMYEKRSRFIKERFAAEPVTLQALYILGEGPDIAITQLPLQAAISDLIANSYVARFGRQLLHGEAAAKHLQQCVQLINQVPVCSLKRPRSLELLPEVAALVEGQQTASQEDVEQFAMTSMTHEAGIPVAQAIPHGQP